MSLQRRSLLAALCLALARPARAEAWPSRPIRLVIPFPPGGGIDMVSRLLAAELTPRLGQPVVAENRPGAGGALGAEMVANARPDGYTLMMGSNGSLVGNLLTQANLTYDPFRQLQPIGLCALLPLVLVVRADSPARDLQDFIARAKARPGRIACGTAGIGSSNHLALALFDAAAGAGITHVPYRGSGPMMPDLLAGNVESLMDQISSSLPLAREGKVRLLAITTEARSSLAPEVPTLVESGYAGAVMSSYNGLCAPAGTPESVIRHLSGLLPDCLAAPTMRERAEGAGIELARPPAATPAQFAAFLRQDLERTRRAVQLAGIRSE
ncbi:tripartite tricarboxylate transporter substrate binding protein [Siccirubricoccus sp. KC 17139]|uniref:Tripartite tricarboxylate transporter substrate binding protein n=1 Tax=Siccirubricoccus soli TaxID=2899147 RepID=A0ABT1CY76_9PROT|nr:tripartite tricarboxylate transporter substrate binding protein [Siccirubricoccus soli]MCO6414621.1 tripartite tricarboxylate transporter substrate binding protein [Siccirubricoccus soli]MCP2680751.1 tripartite tricarboxylate transporter substrate binding protein [Siccirubricoccus soli]